MHDIEHASAQLQMEQMFLRVQRKLFGDAFRRTMAHYALVRPIGQGAMGMVYEALDLRLSREVALKLVLPELVVSERGKSRLVREARAMAKISHPNVVAVYDVGESGGAVYIAMEFVRGATLRRWLAGAQRSIAEIVDAFVQAGAGLAAAHHAGIIHRDFKPDNVLIAEDGRARVVDFGLAFPRIADGFVDRRSQIAGGGDPDPEDLTPAEGLELAAARFVDTVDAGGGRAVNAGTEASASASASSNVLAGTIAYMSPEQLLARSLDARSDQFSFCVSLYEALHGRRPFTGRTFNEFVDRVQRGELAPLESPRRLPAWLAALVARGLSTAPDRRFASMSELVSLLAAGRHGLAAPRAQPATWGDARERLLGALTAELDEQVATWPAAALIRARRIADRTSWLVIAPHDPGAAPLRAAFARYFARLTAADLPRALRPLRLVDDPGTALVFDDLACVPLRGLIERAAGRDPGLALEIACALTRAAHALAQVGLAFDPAALDGLVVGVERCELGPIDPTCLIEAAGGPGGGAGGGPEGRAEDEAEDGAAGRYRVVGAALGALLGADRPPPAGLRAVIDRLVAGGYRSARGVLHDLDRCLAELRRGRDVAPFALGARDLSGAFQPPPVMHGRQRELAELEAAARAVRGGASGLVLVSGPSGIGKTLLIDQAAARLDRGLELRGKFDQYASSEPYATLSQALRGLIGQLLDRPAADRDAWRDRIVSAVAPNGQLLFSMIPELRGVIGDQPAVAAIPPVESAARFGETLKRLLAACAAEVELLVVALDDMQWCDPASSQLIGALLGDREVGHILWICAFRDADHPLHVQLARAGSPRTRTLALALGPLSHAELEALLAEALGCTAERAEALARFFHDKTDGNPLFVRTLLSSLHDQGRFTYSPRHERWGWDDAQIRSAELPGDIQELIVRKIEALSPVARRLLSAASCAGRDVEAALLVEAMSASLPRGELAAALRECVVRGLLAVAPARPGDADAGELVNFTHDRVQQTAHRFLDPALRDAALLELGRALLERSSPSEVGDKLFRIVGYLNAGAAHADAALRERIVELDLAAAQRALVANAFADSVRYLRAALALLPDDRWTSRYELTVELHLEYMHAVALLGDHAHEDELFELLRAHVRTPVHLGHIYRLKVMLESSRGEHRRAIERGIEGLRALGERIPAAPGRLAALAELARTWRAVRRIDPDDLQVRPSSGHDDAAASRLLVALSAPAYLADANLLAIVMMRIVRRSLQFGMSDVSAHGFAGFGLIVAGLLGRYDRALGLAMVAHKLDERFGNAWLAPKVDLMSGIFIQPWTRRFEHCETVLARGSQLAADNADFTYASYNATCRACVMYYRGAPLADVIAAADGALRQALRAGDTDMESVVVTVGGAARCLRGDTASPIDLSTADRDDAALLARLDAQTTPIGVFFCPAIRCGVLYLHGRADLACEHGARASAYEANALANPSFAEYLFYYAMALLRRWHELPRGDRRAADRLIRRALSRFAVWSRHCPDNFASRRALLEAEFARVHGRAGKVLERLNAALESAVRHDRVAYEALAAELAAEHCAALGQATMSRLYLDRAIAAYARWGATAKLAMLAARAA